MNDPWKNINPRFRLYCLAHGYESKQEALAAYNGSGHDYMIWIGQCWRGWERENKRLCWSPKSDMDHAAFDAWLEHKITGGENHAYNA